MPQELDKKVGEWREAERKAREVEKALAHLPLTLGEDSEVPDLVSQAKALRRIADEKLKAAIDAMKPRA
jgi:hypothetical protein